MRRVHLLGDSIIDEHFKTKRPASIRAFWYSGTGIYFLGLSAEEASRGKRNKLDQETTLRAQTAKGDTSWIISTGRVDARTVISQTAEAVEVNGLHDLARSMSNPTVVSAVRSRGGLGEKLPGFIDRR